MSSRWLMAVPFFLICMLAFVVLPAVEAGGGAKSKRNGKEQALVELGRRLFFDPLVSRSGERSCASCHDPEFGFSDPAVRSEDDVGVTRRHSQTIIDSHLNPSAHWDGEFETIEELVHARIGELSGRKGLQGHGSVITDFAVPGGGPRGASGSRAPGAPASADSGAPGERVPAPVEDGADAPASTDEHPTDEPPEDVPGEGDTPEREGANDDSRRSGYFDNPVGAVSPGSRPAADPAESPSADGADASASTASTASSDGGTASGEAEASSPSPTTASSAPAPDTSDGDSRELDEDQLRAKVLADLLKLPRVSDRLEDGGRYREAFRAVFGSTSVSSARIARAIAAYCLSLESTESPYDRFVKGDKAALSPAARRGLALFEGRAGCAQCHTPGTRRQRAAFTDFDFHNTGVAWKELGTAARAKALTAEQIEALDPGRHPFSTKAKHRRAFKTPTLRDLTRRGPYMHNGAFETFEQVIFHYATGGSEDPLQDRRIKPFFVSPRDIADLTEFLKSLTGDERPGVAPPSWKHRSTWTELRFVDGAGRPFPNLGVKLVPVGDLLPADHARTVSQELVTDDEGVIEFIPSRTRTHSRIILSEGLVTTSGDLVPDTCRKAEIVVPVDGKTEVVVVLPKGRVAPMSIVAEHDGTVVLPGHEKPRTILHRTHVVKMARGIAVRYEGWFRTDVPPHVRLRVPGAKAKAKLAVELRPQAAVRVDVR